MKTGVFVAILSLTPAVLAPVPASADPLPDCANTYTGTSEPNCQLTSTDAVGLRFEKRVTGSAAEVRVLDKDGIIAQTIDEPVDGFIGSGTTLLRDLDGDGRDELLLSLNSSGAHGVNSNWAVWHRAGDTTRLQRVEGQLYGGEFWFAGEGYTAAYASGGGWSVAFSRIEKNEFVPVASVGREAQAGMPDPNSPPCSLMSLKSDSFTKQAAEQKFCALTQLRARGLNDYSN